MRARIEVDKDGRVVIIAGKPSDATNVSALMDFPAQGPCVRVAGCTICNNCGAAQRQPVYLASQQDGPAEPFVGTLLRVVS